MLCLKLKNIKACLQLLSIRVYGLSSILKSQLKMKYANMKQEYEVRKWQSLWSPVHVNQH